MDHHQADHYQVQFGVLGWLASAMPMREFHPSYLAWNVIYALKEHDPELGELTIDNRGGLFLLRRAIGT